MILAHCILKLVRLSFTIGIWVQVITTRRNLVEHLIFRCADAANYAIVDYAHSIVLHSY